MKKVVLLLITLLLICGCGVQVKKTDEVKEEEKLSDEYSLPDEHLFTYVDTSELSELLKKGNGILVISTPDNEFSEYFLNIFNDSLKEFNIEKTYYFDALNYKNLEESIKEKIVIDTNKILNPYFYLIKKGKIIETYNLDEYKIENIDIFDNDEFKQELSSYYKTIICKLYSKNNKCKENES